jgi:hypothetical protein
MAQVVIARSIVRNEPKIILYLVRDENNLLKKIFDNLQDAKKFIDQNKNCKIEIEKKF